jgi:hypothetical protein
MFNIMKKLKLSRKKPGALERKLKEAKTLADIERILTQHERNTSKTGYNLS